MTEQVVTEAKRIRQFAAFFKNYMSVSTFVVAALPIPVAQLQMIPMHEADRNSTSVITSLLCFLVLGYIFYSRHRIGRILFAELPLSSPASGGSAMASLAIPAATRAAMARLTFSLLILVLIVCSAAFFFYYQSRWFAYGDLLGALAGPTASAAEPPAGFLENARFELMLGYTAFFVFAEAAFVLMATKEYLQELLGLSDSELIRGPHAISTAGAVSVDAATPADAPGYV